MLVDLALDRYIALHSFGSIMYLYSRSLQWKREDTKEGANGVSYALPLEYVLTHAKQF